MIHTKNKLKKIFIFLLMLIAFFSFPGCFPTEKRTSNQASSFSPLKSGADQIPSRIKKELGENIAIDASVFAKETTRYHISATLKKFDGQKLCSQFFGNSKVKNTEQHENGSVTVYSAENGSYVTVSPGRFMFDDVKDIKKSYWAVLSDYNMYQPGSLEADFTKKELDDFSLQDATKKAAQQLAASGLENLSAPRVIALDYETLKQKYQGVEDQIPEKKMEPFVSQDEAYLFIYQVQYKGLNITGTGYSDTASKKMTCVGSRICVLMTKQGILNITASYIYDFGTETEEKEEAPFDSIYNVLQKKFGDIILDSPVMVTRIDLAYLPVVSSSQASGKWELQPYWVCTVTHKMVSKGKGKTGEYEETFPVYVSFATGKEKEIGEVL